MAKPAGGWKRFMAVGCSHGHLQDDDAVKAALRFKKAWKPHRTIHLGDFIDTAAFRSGAAGTSDETVSLSSDLGHGLNFLKALEPTDVLIGNHEERLYTAMHHYNAIRSEAARWMVEDVRRTVRGLKAGFTEAYDIGFSWITLGDTKFLHGFMYNENAIRDHAEHFGKCVIAHLHTVGEQAARRCDGARAYCVGTLASIPAMSYAKTRRSTARWSHGIAYGEYRENECHVFLTQCAPGNAANWRLPV
jgi:hypothetical protein